MAVADMGQVRRLEPGGTNPGRLSVLGHHETRSWEGNDPLSSARDDFASSPHQGGSVDALLEEFKDRSRTLGREELAFLFLDQRGRTIGSLLFTGNESHVTPDLKQMMKHAISLDASGLLMMHNHPSGDPSPSSQDIATTRWIGKMAQTVGMKLIDHVIVAASAVFSFRERGLI